MLQISDLSKSFGGHILFSQVNFSIMSGEKVGLVGRNGHGKSTLFRMLVGEEGADSGEVRVPKNYKLGYLRQDLSFHAKTVLEEAVAALPKEAIGQDHEAKRILLGLGVTMAEWEKSPHELSGGFQVRLHLAKVLLSRCDLLLLDEPTNYLDIVSLRWLSEFLRRWPSELFLITHDRSFMDSVVDSIVGIHRTKVKKYVGKTENYFLQLAQEEEIYEKTRLNAEKKAKDIELFVEKFRAKARQASLAQSRMKALAKMEIGEKLEAISELDFRFQYAPFAAKWPLIVKDLSFGYTPQKILFSHLSFSLTSEDRLAIIGKNGQGKTTLLNLLCEKLTPFTGDIQWHPQIKRGYFAQTNKLDLNEEATIEEEVRSVNLDLSYTRVRQICGAMMFEGDDAKKKIKILSGGEKSRVLLGKMLATSLNQLILDEPTHHLDLPSCDALIKSLKEFPGSVILVTHDEHLLRAVPNKLVVFQGGNAFYFEGTYDEFLSRYGWDEEKDQTLLKKEAVLNDDQKISKERRRELVLERSKVLKPFKEKMDKLESQIIALESEMEALSKEMNDASGKMMGDLSLKYSKMQKKVDSLFEELSTVTIEHDTKKDEFSRLLGE